METPLVSICCAAYNQAEYIRATLEGFVMQKTDFPFEIVIHDDASTDGTADIIREYEKKYPELIKPEYEVSNQFGTGKVYNIPRAKGTYIAMCEGDDYWTDSLKLQMQVDYMEKHSDCSLCCHHVDIYNQITKEFDCNNIKEGDSYGFKFRNEDRLHLGWFFHMASVMFRRDCLDAKYLSQFKYLRDIHLFYSLLTKGYGYYFKRSMGVYRINKGGIWGAIENEKQVLLSLDIANEFYSKDKSLYVKEWYWLSWLRVERHYRKTNDVKNLLGLVRKYINCIPPSFYMRYLQLKLNGLKKIIYK